MNLPFVPTAVDTGLPRLLDDLSAAARAAGLTDAAWARAAGLPKETLSRLRRRADCDLVTLVALGEVVGRRLAFTEEAPPLVPAAFGREDEARVLHLVATGNLVPSAWTLVRPRFFMAGLACALAGHSALPRAALLRLAEELHPGMTELPVYRRWLETKPLDLGRLMDAVDRELADVA